MAENDQVMIRSGIAADRPASPKVGTIYISTDTGVVEWWDGSAWQAVGGGGGDSITVNGVAVVDADFDDATPAAPAGDTNVKWQKDASSPANVSAYIDTSTMKLRYNWNFNLESPSATEDALSVYIPRDVTITHVRAVVEGSTPSCTYNLKYGDRNAAGTNVTTSPAAVTNETTGVDATINNDSPVTGNWLTLITTAVSGTVRWLHVYVEATED